MTIFAYTDPGISCPAYINVSERVDHPGDVVVTVRSAGENNASAMVLEPIHQRELALALLHKLDPAVALSAKLMLMNAGAED